MLKRIISLLLALSICIIPVFAEEEAAPEVVLSAEREAAAATGDYTTAYGLISAIAPEVTADLVAGDVTRGDFVTRLMKLLKVEPISPITHYFADVDVMSANSPYIHTAAELGWVSKAYTFEPDAIVQLSQAYKMIVAALGYETAAAANGGWPAGYTKMANTMEVSKGITTSGNVDDANMLLLFANVLEVSYTEDKIVAYNGDLADTYLSTIYDVYEAEGLINATRYNSLSYGTAVRADGYMEINGDVYTYDVADEATNPIYNLLGYDVKAYYKKNDANNEIVYVEPTKFNKTNRLEHKDYVGISGNELMYETEDGDIKDYSLDSGYQMVVNGRLTEEPVQTYYAKPGFSSLLDNDGDGDVDIIHTTAYDYMEAAYVDTYNGSIGDVKSAEHAIDLYDNLNLNTLWVRNVDGAAIEFSKVTSNSVLQVAKSEDGKLVSIDVLPTRNGVVEQKTTDGTYIIDGNEYKMSDYFEAYYGAIIAPGAQFTYAVGYGNILAAVTETQQTGYNYALVLDYSVDQLFDKVLKLKVVDTTGNVVVYTTGEKIMLDGIKNSTVNQCINKLLDPETGAVKNQIIKIALNENGELAKIDTPVDYNDDTYKQQVENSDDCLVYFPNNSKTMNYRAATNTFAVTGGGGVNGTGTKLLFTPALNSLTDESDDYRCEQMASALFTDGSGHSLKVYDYNIDTATAGIIVLPGSKTTLGYGEVYFIDEVYETTDAEGNIVTGVSAWKDGVWSNLLLDEDVTYVRDGSPMIQAGDMVRMRVDGKTVTELLVDFNSTTMTYNSTLATGNIEAGSPSLNYTVGVPYTGGDSMVRIITPGMKQDGQWKADLDTLRSIHVYTAKVLKYNYKTKQSRTATINELKTIKNYGIEAADFIIVKQRYERSEMIVLIEDYDKD